MNHNDGDRETSIVTYMLVGGLLIGCCFLGLFF
jgi:hypothetical protein